MKLRPGKGGRSAVVAQGALQTGGDSPAVSRTGAPQLGPTYRADLETASHRIS